MIQEAQGYSLVFDDIYEQYYPVIRSYLASCNGHYSLNNTNDLAQEVFIRFWHQQGRLNDDIAIKAYLFGIAKNVLKEHYRQIQCETALCQSLESVLNRGNHPQSPPDAYAHQELTEAIEQAKAQLPNKQREAIELIDDSKDSHAQAAIRVGCLENVFRQRVYDAQRHLKTLLQEVLES